MINNHFNPPLVNTLLLSLAEAEPRPRKDPKICSRHFLWPSHALTERNAHQKTLNKRSVPPRLETTGRIVTSFHLQNIYLLDIKKDNILWLAIQALYFKIFYLFLVTAKTKYSWGIKPHEYF
jgi:hypothetical protein